VNLKTSIESMISRRQLFGLAGKGLGVAALASLLNPEMFAASTTQEAAKDLKTGATPLCRESQAGDFSASIGRPVTD
jgi:hypothetical protein